MLRVQQEECEREKIAALQAQLEEAHKAQSELDTENRSDPLVCVHYGSGSSSMLQTLFCGKPVD